MDLCERKNVFVVRHPWELARLAAIRSLIKLIPLKECDLHVLDVGCGDGFTTTELFKTVQIKSVTGIDINFTNQQVEELNAFRGKIKYLNDYLYLKCGYYQLILLLDVLEHIVDDKSFTADIADKYLADNGYMLITAPAFHFLFSSHDKFLKHHRRYNRKEIVDLAKYAKLQCLASGYFFLSLLPIRCLLSCYEKMLPDDKRERTGIGAWKRGRMMTKAIELALNVDARISIWLNQLGVHLPGLTVWLLCKKPQ